MPEEQVWEDLCAGLCITIQKLCLKIVCLGQKPNYREIQIKLAIHILASNSTKTDLRNTQTVLNFILILSSHICFGKN